MKKNNKLLMQILFLLSILFIGLLFLLVGYFVNDYINIIHNDTLSGLEHLMFNLFYFIGFLPISALGLITSTLCTKFTDSKKIKVILYIESTVFILGIVFSGVLYF